MKYIVNHLLAASLLLLALPSSADTENSSPRQVVESNLAQKSSKLPASLLRSTTQRRESLPSQWILLDILVREQADELSVTLKDMGMKNMTVSDHLISGRFPVARVSELESLPKVVQIREHRNFTRRGMVRSSGIHSMRADNIARELGYTGKNILIGVLSDSYDCLDGEQADIESGDLPDTVVVVQELTDCESGTDEGRALIQVMYDIAPDASYFFHSGYEGGTGGNAEAIRRLAEDYQVNVIVDDIGSYSDSFFQDNLVAQAIDDVSDGGVTYITAAGNGGTNSYQSRFEPLYDPVLSVTAHDFDTSARVDLHQSLTIPEGETLNLVLQWDEPFFSISGAPGSQSDLDVYLLDELAQDVVASSAVNNLGADPIEVLQFYNPEGSGLTQFQLSIIHAAGRLPALIKYVLPVKFEGTFNEYRTDSSTLIGHSNARGAIAVGATLYDRSTAYGNPINEVELFSAMGGTPILFDDQGQRFRGTAPVRLKPNVTGPDGVNTTFYPGPDLDGDLYPNFRGTSASAPHVAGIAALVLESNPRLTPSNVRQILETTAQDITGTSEAPLPVGFDFRSGHGLVDGREALQMAIAIDPSSTPVSADVSTKPYIPVAALESAPLRQDRSQVGQGRLSGWMLLGIVMLVHRVAARRPELFSTSRGRCSTHLGSTH